MTTASIYRPGAAYRVVIGDAAGIHRLRVRPDRAGRLTTALDLGPANPDQEFTMQADLTQRHATTAKVKIARAR